MLLFNGHKCKLSKVTAFNYIELITFTGETFCEVLKYPRCYGGSTCVGVCDLVRFGGGACSDAWGE